MSVDLDPDAMTFNTVSPTMSNPTNAMRRWGNHGRTRRKDRDEGRRTDKNDFFKPEQLPVKVARSG